MASAAIPETGITRRHVSKRLTLPTGLFLLLLVCGVPAADPQGEDPAAHERMMRVASVLRCLVCQNQTIADSHADLALDLRRQILQMIKEGKSDEDIQAYMVARYGEFVLYRPPVEASTLLLWFGPIGLVAIGGWLVYRAARQRGLATAADAPLSVDQQTLADKLLETPDGGGK